MAKRGPRTEDRRRAIRFNAVKNGLSAASIVIPGWESEEDFDRLRDQVHAQYQPQGPVEHELVERVASVLWRWRRVARAEALAVDVRQARVPSDYAALRAWPQETDPLLLAERAVADAEMARAIVDRLSPSAPDETLAPEAVEAVLDIVRELASHFNAASSSPSYARHVPIATIDAMRRYISLIAEDNARDPRDLYGLAAAVADKRTETAERRREAILSELAAMRKDRLLPDPAQLQALDRHDAHLGRQFYQAHHELLAMQARRAGASVPLAQLQVYGAPEG